MCFHCAFHLCWVGMKVITAGGEVFIVALKEIECNWRQLGARQHLPLQMFCYRSTAIKHLISINETERTMIHSQHRNLRLRHLIFSPRWRFSWSSWRPRIPPEQRRRKWSTWAGRCPGLWSRTPWGSRFCPWSRWYRWWAALWCLWDTRQRQRSEDVTILVEYKTCFLTTECWALSECVPHEFKRNAEDSNLGFWLSNAHQEWLEPGWLLCWSRTRPRRW